MIFTERTDIIIANARAFLSLNGVLPGTGNKVCPDCVFVHRITRFFRNESVPCKIIRGTIPTREA